MGLAIYNEDRSPHFLYHAFINLFARWYWHHIFFFFLLIFLFVPCSEEYVRQRKSNDRCTRKSLMSRASSVGGKRVLDGVCDTWCLQDHCCSLPRNGIEIRDLVDKVPKALQYFHVPYKIFGAQKLFSTSMHHVNIWHW